MVRLLLGVEAGLLEVYCFVHVLGRLVGTLNLQWRGFYPHLQDALGQKTSNDCLIHISPTFLPSVASALKD